MLAYIIIVISVSRRIEDSIVYILLLISVKISSYDCVASNDIFRQWR